MKRHISNTRDHISELAELSQHTEASERRILRQAENRLSQVNELISRARPGVMAASDAGQSRYTDLIAERAQLHIVIAKAQGILGA